MSKNCNYQLLSLSSDKCKFVNSECEFEYFSMLSFHFCVVHNYQWVTFILLPLIIIFCFYILSTTGNRYLAPVLGIISDKLQLSQNIAGLTLLAFGNQAPDIIVAFVAGDDENEGIETSLGSLLGGGIIVVGLVLSTVIYFGKEVQVIPQNYIRDLCMYLISILYISLLGYLGKIEIWQASLLLAFYVVYVIICFIFEKKNKAIENEDNISKTDNEKQEIVIDEDYRISLYQDSNNTTIIKEEQNDRSNLDSQTFNTTQYNTSLVNDSYIDYDKILIQSFLTRKNEHHYFLSSDDNKKGKAYSKFQYDLFRCYLNNETKWENKNAFQKIVYILIDFPCDIIRDATIPAYESAKWKRTMFIIQPFTISLFFIVIFNLYHYMITYKYIAIGWFCLMGIISIIFYRISYRTSLPSWHWFLLVSSFIISILWLWFITNILIDMIITFKLLLPINIPQSFLSMTILAFGNSLPDFIVNTSLAKNGYAEMALSGSIGAPVFGILFGFGLSLMKRLIGKYITTKKTFELFDLFNFSKHNLNNLLIVDAFACISVLLIGLMICGIIRKFKINKISSVYGYIIYSLFFISIIYFSFLHFHFFPV